MCTYTHLHSTPGGNTAWLEDHPSKSETPLATHEPCMSCSCFISKTGINPSTLRVCHKNLRPSRESTSFPAFPDFRCLINGRYPQHCHHCWFILPFAGALIKTIIWLIKKHDFSLLPAWTATFLSLPSWLLSGRLLHIHLAKQGRWPLIHR